MTNEPQLGLNFESPMSLVELRDQALTASDRDDVRVLTLAADRHRCQNLRCRQQGGKLYVSLVRLIPESEGGYKASNLVTLCDACRRRAEHGADDQTHGIMTGYQFKIYVLDQHLFRDEWRWTPVWKRLSELAEPGR
jgi:5-methylcytosine-specific restriction endonuclease McrA